MVPRRASRSGAAWARGLLTGAVACASPAVLTACAGAAGSTRIEDKARRDVPIAICRKSLTAEDTNEGGAPRVEAYWSVIFPSFRGFASPLASTARDCVGDPILLTDNGAAPAIVAPKQGDWSSARSEDGLEAVWLRATPLGERAAGVLALVRGRPSELDVYSLGAYRGSARHSRMEFARMGAGSALLVQDESCGDAAAGTDCESDLFVYMIAGGQLTPVAKTPTECIRYGAMKDLGRVQWRLTTDPPLFDAQTMRIKEKLSVRDSRDDEVRKSEGERTFMLRGSELVAGSETLWAQVPKP